MGASTVAQYTAKLVTQFPWSDGTESSRQSQWKAWIEFCSEDGRQPLPATEGHFVAFIGWLKLSRERGTRSVGSSSLPQYLSAVRRMHELYVGRPVENFPFVEVVVRAYGKWEEQGFPTESVRCGIDATTALRIWSLGMRTGTLAVLRDCAVVLCVCLRTASTGCARALRCLWRPIR